MTRKLILLFLALSLVFTAEWKRVDDLPDYDSDDLKQPEEDPEQIMNDLDDLFNKIDPTGTKRFTKTQYKEILKDLVLGTERRSGIIHTIS